MYKNAYVVPFSSPQEALSHFCAFMHVHGYMGRKVQYTMLCSEEGCHYQHRLLPNTG